MSNTFCKFGLYITFGLIRKISILILLEELNQFLIKSRKKMFGYKLLNDVRETAGCKQCRLIWITDFFQM
jgi:hypothetical protein